MKAIVFTLIVLVSTFPVTSAHAQQPQNSKPKTLVSSGYAPVNGLKMYYEIHGAGKPVVLLHGSYMNIDMNYGPLITKLAPTHKVIALEMQGHGRTADIDRPFSYKAFADDVAGLLKFLKVDSADIIGYSLGGTVALQMGINHPQLVKKLVIISSVYKFTGWQPDVRQVFLSFKPEFFDNTPLKPAYQKIAPDPAHWSAFVKKNIQFDTTDFDLGADKIKAMRSPVLLIKGDNDGVDLNHITDLYRLCGGGTFGDMAGLPKSQLAIFPGTTHVTVMMETDKLAGVIQPFLDNKTATVGH
jgi:pimeloyl-ACP methyl ester carboxylesterase